MSPTMPPRPVQHALAFGRQALKPAAAKHQLHAQLILQLPDGATTGLGCVTPQTSAARPKWRSLGQGDEHFQLVDHAHRNLRVPPLPASPARPYLWPMKRFIPFLPKPALVPVIRLQGTIGTGLARPDGCRPGPADRTAFKGQARRRGAGDQLARRVGGAIQPDRRAHPPAGGRKEHPGPCLCRGCGGLGRLLAGLCGGSDLGGSQSSLVGSIGVIFASFGFPELMARQGIERRVVTAGRSKSFADPFLPQKPEDVDRLRALQTPIHRGLHRPCQSAARGAADGRRPVQRRYLGGPAGG